MIERITIENFKSLKKVDLKLGRLNLFIGTNASGKSNFFDALRVLQGIGYGFTIHEILDGKSKSTMSIEWEPIRGGIAQARFYNGGSPPEETMRFGVEVSQLKETSPKLSYSIGFNPVAGRLTQERLQAGSAVIYDSDPANNTASGAVFYARYSRPKGRGKKPHLEFERSRPVLSQLNRHQDVTEKHRALRDALAEALGNTQRMDPAPEMLRSYSQAQQIRRMGDRGENFAALVKTICESSKDKEAFVAWLRELRPAEVDEVATLTGALGEPLFALREHGREFPAPVLSDGTLRFAAITAAFFQPDLPAALTIEEIEKGIHASRLRLLLELLKNQAGQGRVQVMATTHSRSVLDWLEEEDYATTFYCQRDPETGESRIVPLTEVPHLLDAVKKQSLGDLFTENWLEAAL